MVNWRVNLISKQVNKHPIYVTVATTLILISFWHTIQLYMCVCALHRRCVVTHSDVIHCKCNYYVKIHSNNNNIVNSFSCYHHFPILYSLLTHTYTRYHAMAHLLRFFFIVVLFFSSHSWHFEKMAKNLWHGTKSEIPDQFACSHEHTHTWNHDINDVCK